MEEEGEGGAVGQGQCDALRSEVDAERVEEGEEEEVGDGEEDEGLCGGGYLVVLAAP